jgi:hypothetical protein
MADLVTVYAVTDKAKRAPRRHHGLPRAQRTQGLPVGKREEKMGQRGSSSTVDALLRGRALGDEYRLGEVGEGFKIAMGTLDRGRLALSRIAWVARGRRTRCRCPTRTSARSFGKPLGAPGDPVDARRQRHGHLRDGEPGLPHRVDVRPGAALQSRVGDGQALRQRGARPRRRPRRADPRRHGLLGGVRDREALPRRARHAHL